MAGLHERPKGLQGAHNERGVDGGWSVGWGWWGLCAVQHAPSRRGKGTHVVSRPCARGSRVFAAAAEKVGLRGWKIEKESLA